VKGGCAHRGRTWTGVSVDSRPSLLGVREMTRGGKSAGLRQKKKGGLCRLDLSDVGHIRDSSDQGGGNQGEPFIEE